MKLIFALIDALYKGKELSRADVWKNAAMATSLLTGLLGSLAVITKRVGYDLGLTTDDFGTIASSVVLLLGAYVHAASSKKVGLPSRGTPTDGGQPATASAPAEPVAQPVAQSVRPVAQSPAAHLVAQTRSVKSAPQSDPHASWLNRELDKSGG